MGGRGSAGGNSRGGAIGNKSFKLEGKISDSNITENMVVDGAVIDYSGKNLGSAVDAIANNLNVGDEFVISNNELGFVTPNPTAADRTGQYRETRFLVTDSYRYGNGFAPIYSGDRPPLNKGKDRTWRDITDGALFLSTGSKFQIKIHRKS